MRASTRVARVLVAVVAIVFLALPGLMMAVAWGGTLNLEIALAGVGASIAVAIWAKRWRWFAASIASLLIAVPPFPYWSNWDENTGRYLHFFRGFSLQDLPLANFAIFFVLAMLLFAAVFWAIESR